VTLNAIQHIKQCVPKRAVFSETPTRMKVPVVDSMVRPDETPSWMTVMRIH
jgi:hypothetical protein